MLRITENADFGLSEAGNYDKEKNPQQSIEIEVLGGYEIADSVIIKQIYNSYELSSDINNFKGRAFKYDGTKLFVGQILAPGEKIILPAKFVAPEIKAYSADLTIVSDAEVHSSRPDFSNWKTTWTGLGTDGTSVRNENSYFDISLSPNPIGIDGATLNFKLSQGANVQITLLDINGLEVMPIASSFYDMGTHSLPISIKNIANGSYFIRLNSMKNKELIPVRINK